MKLETAIEILQTEAHLAQRQPETDIYDATKLGIEALTAIREWRKDWAGSRFHALPGETDAPPLTPFRSTIIKSDP